MTLPRNRGGMGIPLDWIHLDSIKTAANICDELVTVKKIDGSGTEQIKRYRCDTLIDTEAPPAENLDIILSAMNGRRVFTAGQYRVVAGAFRAATLTLTDAHVIGTQPISVVTASGDDAPANVVTARFADSTKNWTETSPKPVRNDSYVTLDGNESPLDISLPATTDPRRANYLMGVALEQNRPAFGITLTVGGIGEDLAIFDCVQLNLANRPTYAGKTYEIVKIVDQWNGEFELTLVEIRPQTWALDPNTWTPSDPVDPADLSYLWNVQPLVNFNALLGTPQVLPDGTSVARAILSWNQVTQQYVRTGGRIELRYREQGGEWIGVAAVPGDSIGTIVSASLLDTRFYQFQARVVNGIGAASTWVTVWLQVEGTELAEGIQGPGLFTWGNPVGVETSSSSIKKTTASGAWNAGAHSLQSYSTGCYAIARPADTTTSKMFGLNNDPDVDVNFTGINYAWRADATGALQIYENGILINNQGTYTAQTQLAITYDSRNVVYLKDGVVVRTTPATGLRLFLDVSLFTLGAEWQDIAFGPQGAAGADGIPGTAAQVLRLSASAQAFTYDAAGAASPAGQVITFTANRQNIAGASVFSTTPAGIALGGSGDTRTLAIAAFGANQSVKVRVDAGGFFDEITVVRLQQGANGPGAVVGVLTNENHTLAADKDGVVGTFAGAVGNFLVFEGLIDRTTLATFSIASTVACTAQINTAANTPVAGQPKGYYRVTAVSADQASVTLHAVYNGVTIDKVFTVTRARQGIPGDGANLLHINDWVIGTTGSQGSFAEQVSGVAVNALVLGGAGSAPVGPFGITEPLWECRADAANPIGNADGGWNYNNIPINPKKTYRATVWIRANLANGRPYFGAGSAGTLNLDGAANTNPYFVSSGSIWTSLLDKDQWYLAVGLIHGSDYAGVDSGFSGIYDPRTGKRVFDGVEYKMAAAATVQTHRCYFYDATSASARQWMARPRFEEVNGNEPSIYDLMGLRLPTPWIERGQCVAGASSFQKQGGVNGWDSDISSVTRFNVCHLQFKPKQNNLNFMVGLNTDPLSSQAYQSIDFTWYCHPSGLQIYESGVLMVANAGTYTAGTEFGITYEAAAVRYYKDRVLQRTVNIASQNFFLDSSFYSPTAACDVVWGPGTEFEATGTDALTVSAVPDSRSVNADFSGVPLAGELPFGVQVTVFSGSTNVTASATYSHTVSNVTATNNGSGSYTINNVTDDSGYLQVTVTHGGRTVVKRITVSLVKGGATATSQTTNTVATRNLTTYGGVQAGPLIIPVGPGGTITLSARRPYGTSAGGTLAGKFQYRTTPGSGSFIDFGPEVAASGAFPGENDVLAFNQNLAGPTDGANWEFQFLNRRSAGTDVSSSGSNARFTASWTT